MFRSWWELSFAIAFLWFGEVSDKDVWVCSRDPQAHTVGLHTQHVLSGPDMWAPAGWIGYGFGSARSPVIEHHIPGFLKASCNRPASVCLHLPWFQEVNSLGHGSMAAWNQDYFLLAAWVCWPYLYFRTVDPCPLWATCVTCTHITRSPRTVSKMYFVVLLVLCYQLLLCR